MPKTDMALLLSALALAGCSGTPAAAPDKTLTTPQEASVRAGDIVVRANAMPTAALGAAVAQQYGIARDAKHALLLVGVRRGSDADETALPARVTASATDLLGKRQQIAMREVRSADFIDYVGSVAVIAPDTLRFDISVIPGPAIAAQEHPMRLRFNRDFFAR